MPIVQSVQPGPLRQGDILTSLQLYVSSCNGADLVDADFCVVISRDCNTLRSSTIIVAEIRRYAPQEFTRLLEEPMSMDKARQIMDTLRDGDGMPDTCYIGPLGGDPRYAVRLDSLHTVGVPDASRQEWVDSRRKFQLAPDFVRHLQIRLFSSIAKQGFDDFRWWPQRDLETLVTIGEREVGEKQTLLATAKLELEKAKLGTKTKEVSNREKAVAKRKVEFRGIIERLGNYRAELSRRNSQ